MKIWLGGGVILLVIIAVIVIGLNSNTPNSSKPASSILPTTSSRQNSSSVANSTSMSSTTTPSGLKIADTVIGTGPAVKSGDTVTIHYKGTLLDGTKFDSSYDRNQPFSTRIGVGQVIKGWDEGIVGMQVGGKRTLTIPPELGYGPNGTGPIPGNSTLIFETELLAIK